MAGAPLTVLEGQVERVTYQNPSTGYAVFRLRTTDDQVTVVGRFPGLGAGEELRISGEYVTHPTYGRQFKAGGYETILPTTTKGIEAYLGSGLVKGVGPALARRLVAAFGARTLEVIERTPRRLLGVPGIGPAKVAAIHQAVMDQRELREVLVFLEGHGISPIMAQKIHDRYGAGAIGVVRDNPYRLAEEVSGIGFRIADRIARNLGFDPASPRRIQAAADYLLGEAAASGHCFLPRPVLLEQVAELLSPDVKEIDEEEVVAGLQFRGRVVREPFSGEDGEITEAIFPTPFHRMERKVVERLARLVAEPGAPAMAHLADVPEATGGRDSVILSSQQRAAVAGALGERLYILTGGPGTGKTTVLRALLQALEAREEDYLLAAPTGRAAKRLAEATGRPARTLHRLLEYGFAPGEGAGFARTATNPLPDGTVIVDEASMIDLPLFSHLVDALPDGGRLLLVGDADQLPSVGPGNVLRDLLESGCVPAARLGQVYRQAEGSRIVENAHRILSGEFPLFDPQGMAAEFVLIEETDGDRVADRIVALTREMWSREPGGCQVIAPMRRGASGVEHLNARLQEALNPRPSGGPELKWRDAALRPGDRVMQTRNDYPKEVFNGDLGVVEAVSPDTPSVRVVYPDPAGDRAVTYEGRDLDEITLAYAVTVHKSQGSEYPTVVLALTTQHYPLLQRNLFYTAVTRARRRVAIVGSRKAMYLALRNDKAEKRYTRLKDRLSEAVYAAAGPKLSP